MFFSNFTSFSIAVKKGNLDIVKLLLKQPDTNIFNKSIIINFINIISNQMISNCFICQLFK